jgi:hypothetical protein
VEKDAREKNLHYNERIELYWVLKTNRVNGRVESTLEYGVVIIG